MKSQEIKLLCHKCGKEVEYHNLTKNCPHCDHSISLNRIRIGYEDKYHIIYEVLV